MDHGKKQKREPHPRDQANFVHKIFFLFTWKLYRKGFSKDLDESDLYEVLNYLRSKNLGDQLEAEWEKQKKQGKELSVVRLLWICYGMEFFFYGIMEMIIQVTAIVVQPWSISKLVSYFREDQTDVSIHDAYFYAGVLITTIYFERLYKNNYFLLLMQFGVKIRTAFCSFLYRKALKLCPSHLGDISIGKIVTLISKDVHSFEHFVEYGNDIWIAVIKTIVISYLLYNKLGLAALIGVSFLLFMIPMQLYLGSKVTALKIKMCKRSDDRLQITQETLSAIRIIKMYTWEMIFDSKISKARKKEVQSTYKIFFLEFAVVIFGSLNAHIAFYIMLMTYVWQGNYLSAEIVYYVTANFNTLDHTLSSFFPLAIIQTAELKAAITRIGNVLKSLEIETSCIKESSVEVPKIRLENVTISIKSVKVLNEINLDINQGLTLITGVVGSGKSTLLRTILRDYTPENGSILVKGAVSYASQEPWLFPSSIKQNIVFGEEYNEKRYQEVLKVCALIYDFELLENGDETIVEDRGINLSKGQQSRINLARAVYKNSNIYLLDDCLAALDAHVSAYIFKECIVEFLKDKLVIFVTHNSKYLGAADNIVCIKNGGLNMVSPIIIQTTNVNNNNTYNLGKRRKSGFKEKYLLENINEDTKLLAETVATKRVYQESKQTGAVNFKVYKKYMQFGGGFCLFFVVFLLFGVGQVVISYTDKLLSEWSNVEAKMSMLSLKNITNGTEYEQTKHQRETLHVLYSVMTVSTAFCFFARAFSLFFFARKASIQLHKQMIYSIINGTMQFFDNNFIGNILNRFSKDLTTIDEQIPYVFYFVFRTFFILIGTITIIVTVKQDFIIPTIIFGILLVLLRYGAIRTVRNLKRLDASTRSPVVGYLNATLEGLTTIRAFKAQAILKQEFDRHQDLYTSAYYSLMSSFRAFAYLIDSLCSVFIAFIVIRFFWDENIVLAGTVGLVISQAKKLSDVLQLGIRQWAEIENQMTSVERVLEYTDIKQESKQGQVLENWPKAGRIQYDNVSLSYTNSGKCVLKDLNFTIEPNEKIGVVGRTGAGKSSIIASLFRLYEVEGRILIDGVDTKTLSLDFLRGKISIIPQDPVVFTGTIRENIDPTKCYSDEEIWKAIDTSNLKKLVPTLDYEVTDSGSNFSIGQRQLICLARAVAKENKIIVLDEASANMDDGTDLLIRKTIENNFSQCTVFTIAHKLKTIIDSDRIMVLDKGEIIEFDTPNNLLNNSDGVFYQMAKKDGIF